MKIALDPIYNWQTVQNEAFTVHRIGHKQPLDVLLDFLNRSDGVTPSQIGEILGQQIGNLAAIIEGPSFIVAFVDTIRSYPLFYTQGVENLILSNSARLAKDEARISTLDDTALLEFCMAGYVTGRETIYQNLFQVQAGELLFWDKTARTLTRERYYEYYPQEREQQSEEAYIEQLGDVTDRVFRRVIENANGAPIWIPLSGGYDSRLIVCKLKQLGYDRLMTFSYGPRGNYEAKTAKYVADTLGVPWSFVPPNGSKARTLFQSPTRKQYWDFADGLSSIPVMNEFETLLNLREQGKLPDDAVLVNGQSGDFISGAHIPALFMQDRPSVRQLLDAIVNKHFSVWMHLKSESNLAKIESKILHLLPRSEDSDLSREEIAAQYEYWEWQERQSKYVVHGQRLYDFLGLAWELPLWDAEFMRFWQTVPLKHRFGQSLYRKYMERFDYKGLFKGHRSEARRWPSRTALWVRPTEKMLRTLLGPKYQNQFAKYASYFGHYSNYYAMYGFKHFVENIPKATVPPQGRGFVALNIQTLLRENGIGTPF
jgi:asparagine synthase (glutamine-hydrolysing)